MNREAPNNHVRVAYIGATLPTLSETFVSNELLAVRAAGLPVTAVSVFRPDADGLEDNLRELAAGAMVVYSARTWLDAIAELVKRPGTGLRTLGIAAWDMLCSRDAATRSRLRVPGQALAAIGLCRRLRAAGVTHLHAHMANTPATIAMYAAIHLGVGFSFTGHANDLFVHRTFLPEKLRRARFAACISRWHRALYQRLAELSDERLPVIRCGVDTSNAADTGDVQPSEGLRLLSVGRLVPKKGMDVLVRAVAEIDPAVKLRCEIIGDGPQRGDLARLIQELGVENRVHLLGALPNAAVLDRVRRCDVFVLACRRDSVSGDQDGIPVSLMEAMAASRCVVTTALTPIDELVIDGETGVSVPANDPSSLAEAITRLASDPDLRRRLAMGGRRHVVREFDRVANAQRLIRCILSSRGVHGLPAIADDASAIRAPELQPQCVAAGHVQESQCQTVM